MAITPGDWPLVPGAKALARIPPATLSTSSFTAALKAGAEIATISTNLAGAVVENISAKDDAVVLSSDKTKLLRGLAPLTVGDLDVSIFTSHPKASRSPVETRLKLSCTAPPIAAITSVTIAALTAGATWDGLKFNDFLRADVVATGTYAKIAYSWRADGNGVSQNRRFLAVDDRYVGKKITLALALLDASNAVLATYTTPVPSGTVTDSLIVLDGMNATTGWTASNSNLTVDNTAGRFAKGSGLNIKSNGNLNAGTLTKTIGGVDLTKGIIIARFDTRGDQTTGNIGIAFKTTAGSTYSTRTSGKSQRDLGSNFPNGTEWLTFGVKEEDASTNTITALGDASVSKDMRIVVSPNAPGVTDMTLDCVLKADEGRAGIPTLVLTYDDIHPDAYTEVFPYLRDREVRGTLFVPSAKIGQNEDGTSNKNLVWSQIAEMDAAGWCIGSDITVDDGYATTMPSIQAVVDGYGVIDEALRQNTSGRGRGFACWPFGSFGILTNKTTATVTFTTGSNQVAVTAGTVPTVGQTLIGFPVMGLAEVIVTAVSGSNVTLSCQNADITLSGSYPIASNDRSSIFYGQKLIAALKAAGLKAARATFANPLYTRFGYGDRWLSMPGWGMSGASVPNGSSDAVKQASRIASLDETERRGQAILPYIHSVTGTTDESINISIPNHRNYIDNYIARRDAGRMIDLPLDELYARDYDGASRLPAAA